MIPRILARSAHRLATTAISKQSRICQRCAGHRQKSLWLASTQTSRAPLQNSLFHTTAHRNAQSPTADELMENLEDLYATAKDEFEIAAEETEKKTVYAQDDRDAAREALTLLRETFDKAVKESDPDVAKDITRRAGQRVRELENAVTAMEESAMEE